MNQKRSNVFCFIPSGCSCMCLEGKNTGQLDLVMRRSTMDEEFESRQGYKQQQSIEVPPVYAWPPRPLASLRWLGFGILFPLGFCWIGLALFSWYFLNTSEQTMSVMAPGWGLQIWLRNAFLLLLVAGGLHAGLYLRRAQEHSFKYNSRWPARDSRKFLWKDQVKDNMFWSLISGCSFWTLF